SVDPALQQKAMPKAGSLRSKPGSMHAASKLQLALGQRAQAGELCQPDPIRRRREVFALFPWRRSWRARVANVPPAAAREIVQGRLERPDKIGNPTLQMPFEDEVVEVDNVLGSGCPLAAACLTRLGAWRVAVAGE